ncbi:MAG: hypothetical protein WDO24_05700 [Pseudomonadota bacterium]
MTIGFRREIEKFNSAEARDALGRWTASVADFAVDVGAGAAAGSIAGATTLAAHAAASRKLTGRMTIGHLAAGALTGALVTGGDSIRSALRRREQYGPSLRGAKASRKLVRQQLLAHNAAHGKERVVVVDSSGRVQFDALGGKTRVRPLSPTDELLGRKQDPEGYSAHNHPGRGGPPSTADLRVSSQTGNQHGTVYTGGGGIYRYKTNLADPSDARAQRHFAVIAAGADETARREMRLSYLQRTRSGTRNMSDQNETDLVMAGHHGKLLGLKDAGVINYRYRLDPDEQRAVNNNLPLVAKTRVMVGAIARDLGSAKLVAGGPR